MGGRWTLLLFYIAVALSCTSAYYNSDYLDEKIEILTNEVSRLSDELSDKPDPATENPVLLLSAHRNVSSNTTVFKIRYTKNIQDVFVESSILEPIINNSKDFSTLTLNCTSACYGDEETVTVTFTNRNKTSSLKLSLNLEGGENYQDSFTVPILQVQHEGDLVYYPGSDAKILVSSSTTNGGYSGTTMMEFMRKSLTYVDHRNNRLISEATDEDLLSSAKKTVYLKTTDWEVTVFTGRKRYLISGFLQLSQKFIQRRDAFVSEITTQRSVVLRPVSQTGPYPDGFLKFNTQLYDDRIFLEGYEQLLGSIPSIHCTLGTACLVTCEVIGSSRASMILESAEQYGNWTAVTSASQTDRKFSQTLAWTVQAREGDLDTLYRCTALDSAHGTNKTQLVYVQIFSETVTFDPQRSGYEVSVNRSVNPPMMSINMRCTVIGRPVNGVVFQYRTEAVPQRRVYAVYERTPGASEVTVNSQVELDADFFGELEGVTCMAYRPNGGYQLELSETNIPF